MLNQVGLIARNFIFLIFFALMTGCEPVEPPPYLIVSGEISSEACENFQHMGFLLEIKNVSDQSIVSLSFELQIVDGEGNPYPDYQNSIFTGVYDFLIESQSTEIIAIPIEDQLIQIPSEPIVIRQLHIYQVDFESGERWSDQYGVYLLEF